MATSTKTKAATKSSVPVKKAKESEVVEKPIEIKEEVKSIPEVPVTPEVTETPEVIKASEPTRQYGQNDLVLCKSVTAGWLGVSGKSGQYYIFENVGDECEIEYQDLFALKSRRSRYIYDPLFIIEDEELLENPRWADLKEFYDGLYDMSDVNEVLNLPYEKFVKVIAKLPKGFAKTIQVEVAERIENGTFDSIKKIKAMDETFGTDFRSILAD